MNKALILILVLCTAFLTADAFAEDPDPNGVEFELIVRQKPSALNKYFEITRDTIRVVDGGTIYASLVNMSLDLQIEEVDSQYVTFTSHLVTFGSEPYNFAERYRIEYNLPARIENIPGKNESSYQLLISPRKRVAIDTTICKYDPGRKGDFKMDPSAHFDIYYVEGSLGDFFWNNIKNYLETDLTQFRTALDINTPGKINFHIFPCPAPEINWDKRFGYAIDPGRSNVYAIYNHGFSSIDAMLPNMLLLLHLWGYSPPFLVEGMAGYFDFVTYKMKKLKADGNIPKLETMLTTSGYYSADPEKSEIMAGSFVKFLADSRGISKFMDLYEKSGDLTILSNFEKIYGLGIDSLETEWLYYLDTLELSRKLFDLYAARANALFQSDLQIEYLEQMLNYDLNPADSLDNWQKLATTYYQYGHYYQAEDAYRKVIELDSAKPVYYQILGNLAMINGEYDKAGALFDTVMTMDSTLATALLQKAYIKRIAGDTAAAIDIAEKGLGREESAVGRVEFMLFLGELYNTSGRYRDSARADKYFNDALVIGSDIMHKVPQDAVMKLRVGMALMGLGRYEDARQFIDIALFTELRTFYLGRAALYMGRLYDLMGDHAKAAEYYSRGLEPTVAAYHRDMCLQYLDQPYRR